MSKYKSLITKAEELVVGNTYFVVHKIHEVSWVTDNQVNSKPKKCNYTDSLYIDTESYNSYAKDYLIDRLFLNDFNIPENTYNKHCIFSDEKEAIDYANS